ncbi:tRNA-dihydrouridine synthase 2, partial [Tremellales sp. Uapishka_1]
MPIATTRSASPPGSPRPTKRIRVEVDPENAAASTSVVIIPTVEALDSSSSPSIPAMTGESSTEAEIVEREMSLPVEFAKSYAHELDYRNKLVLAPMVRTGSLPMRLLSLYYGAGLVWSPEVVDKAIIGAERIVDVIFQIGSSDPELAVKAAKTVEQDVSGITHSGMGAALLSTPTLLLNILRALLDSVALPISCKIRLLPTQPATLELASRILRTGIRNLTVHCRTRDMRPGEPAIWDRLCDIVKLGKRRGVSMTCNGDGDGWGNWEAIKSQTDADSVMIARAAERNPSIFLPTGPVSNVTDNIPKLLNICERINNPWGNTKFLLNQFKPSARPVSNMTKAEKVAIQDGISRSKTLAEVGEKLGVQLGCGKALMEEIEEKIRSRTPTDIFEERREAEADGKVVDEPVENANAGVVEACGMGVGQAAAGL